VSSTFVLLTKILCWVSRSDSRSCHEKKGVNTYIIAESTFNLFGKTYQSQMPNINASIDFKNPE